MQLFTSHSATGSEHGHGGGGPHRQQRRVAPAQPRHQGCRGQHDPRGPGQAQHLRQEGGGRLPGRQGRSHSGQRPHHRG